MKYGSFASNKDALKTLAQNEYNTNDIKREFRDRPYDDMRDTWSFERKENPERYVELSRSGITVNLVDGEREATLSYTSGEARVIRDKFIRAFGDGPDEPTNFRKNYE